MLQPDQIERIISSVEEPYRGNPDHEALGAELDGVVYVWRYLSKANSRGDARAKQKQFADIAKHGSRFRDALNQHDRCPPYYADAIIKPDAERISNEEEAARNLFLENLQRVVDAAEGHVKTFGKLSTDRLLDRSPTDWLAGDRLPVVYNRHFPRAAGVSLPSGKKTPDGPFVRFAVTVFKEIGAPISAHTVARALKNVRGNRTRRKSKRQSK
ncbi:hypothetical protein [Bradyrhizobium sp. AUGA SZCCT0182]|uniref:hypothetical protein n=1 Tax=Bradyrhizobium sp. AUGA SZCCT0182 TaxID=2807667 RepID=UPI001BA80309|nr:hypothetical protein [Bradyrhizobium sp. AUGA SZCCT0182]MBR1235185.1 hypothetical protein [Bradyrhizobium sp. AUGA SZCCT0182]